MNQSWQQSTLFPDEGGVRLEIHMSLSTEGQRIGCWVRAHKMPKGHQVAETITWHNFTDNGMCGAIETILGMVTDTAEHHGLELEKTIVDRISAPF